MSLIEGQRARLDPKVVGLLGATGLTLTLAYTMSMAKVDVRNPDPQPQASPTRESCADIFAILSSRQLALEQGAADVPATFIKTYLENQISGLSSDAATARLSAIERQAIEAQKGNCTQSNVRADESIAKLIPNIIRNMLGR